MATGRRIALISRSSSTANRPRHRMANRGREDESAFSKKLMLWGGSHGNASFEGLLTDNLEPVNATEDTSGEKRLYYVAKAHIDGGPKKDVYILAVGVSPSGNLVGVMSMVTQLTNIGMVMTTSRKKENMRNVIILNNCPDPNPDRSPQYIFLRKGKRIGALLIRRDAPCTTGQRNSTRTRIPSLTPGWTDNDRDGSNTCTNLPIHMHPLQHGPPSQREYDGRGNASTNCGAHAFCSCGRDEHRRFYSNPPESCFSVTPRHPPL